MNAGIVWESMDPLERLKTFNIEPPIDCIATWNELSLDHKSTVIAHVLNTETAGPSAKRGSADSLVDQKGGK